MSTEYLVRKFNNAIASKGSIVYSEEKLDKYSKEFTDATNRIIDAINELRKGNKHTPNKKGQNVKALNEIENEYRLLVITVNMFIHEKQIPYTKLQTFLFSLKTKNKPQQDVFEQLDINKTIEEFKAHEDELARLGPEEYASATKETIKELTKKVHYKYSNLFQKCYDILLMIAENKLYLRGCKQCDKLFITIDPRARYCSQECKKEEKRLSNEQKRKGLYGERERIYDLFAKRELYGYGQNKKITRAEFEAFDQKIQEQIRLHNINADEALIQYENIHKQIIESV